LDEGSIPSGSTKSLAFDVRLFISPYLLPFFLLLKNSEILVIGKFYEFKTMINVKLLQLFYSFILVIKLVRTVVKDLEFKGID